MSDIRTVTIEKINLGTSYLRRYHVQYCSGVCRSYGIPPETVDKFVEENQREFAKVKYTFRDASQEDCYEES